MIHKSGASSD